MNEKKFAAGLRGKAPHPSSWLGQGGEMGKLIRSMNWSKTPLGPLDLWPQSLRTTVSLCLASNFPISIAWGPNRTQIYNDGYWPICGAKHPQSMGQDFKECWFSAWPAIGDAFERANRGETAFLVNQRMFLDRHGFLEETFFTFSFSPIRDETGGVAGLFHPVTELTQQSIAERRLRVLRDVADKASDAKSVNLACEMVIQTLGQHDLDLPFALLYLVEGDGNRAVLKGSAGLQSNSVFPATIDLKQGNTSPWRLSEAATSRQIVEVADVADRLGSVQCGPYPEMPHTAFSLPISVSGITHPIALLVAGASARRPLDEPYRMFYAMLREAVTNALTNARTYEEERKRSEALAELDRAKTAFFSNVSHEFRTPLTLILGPVGDILADRAEALAPRHRDRLEIVYRNSLRLQKLVNSLLDFSRIEAGRVQARYEPTDLAALTSELASNFRSACEKAGLKLIVDCPKLDEPVYVDRDMWEKITLNLLSNAFKYTLEGEIAVCVRQSNETAELVIRDTGVGIPEEEMPKLFERFHRVEGTRGRTQEGSGIGLALVQELVRLHGGKVSANSKLGEGTAIRVVMRFGKGHLNADRIGVPSDLASTVLGAAPFLEEALRWLPDESGESDVSAFEPLTTNEPMGQILAPAGEAAERPRVLLADDNADMRDYVRRLLLRQYEVVAVPDGHAALEAARRKPPDLVISDVMMPGLDGFGLVKALRERRETRELPILLLSARAGEEARIEGLEAGADDYLTKPFGAKELMARVTTHLALARLRREAAKAVRESEQKFRFMADTAPAMLWVTDVDNQCIFLSRGWHEYTGQTREEGLGLGWIDAVHPEDRERSTRIFLEAAAKKVAFQIDYRLETMEGEYRWAIDAGRPQISDTGEFLGYIGSVIDIHERKRLEGELRRTAADLSEANRKKDEFLAMLAHELRNPLAPIRTGLALLKRSDFDAALRDSTLTTIERQTQQLITLVDDLLDVSRITRGRLELRRTHVRLNEIIQIAVEASRPFIDENAHELSVAIPFEDIFLYADPNRLAQVFSNLLNNAAKYTPNGGFIELSVKKEDESVTVVVKDNGIGIPEPMRESIFQMFTQFDHPQEKGYTGLGIGLTLVKSLVEMHGGCVSVQSGGKNKGSVFRIKLPVVEKLDCDGEKPSIDKETTPTPKRRVLVVDDNKAVADTLRMLVSIMGNDVRTASDGEEAIEIAATFAPDIVLMDLGMPRKNGYEAARHIRQQPWGKKMKLVAFSGWGQDVDKRKTKEAGFDEHLVKPADPEQLKRLLS